MPDKRKELLKMADVIEEGFFVEDESDLAASEEARQAIKAAKTRYLSALETAQAAQFDNQFAEVACPKCGASKPTCCACPETYSDKPTVADFIADRAIGCRNCGDSFERVVRSDGTVESCEDCGDAEYSLYAIATNIGRRGIEPLARYQIPPRRERAGSPLVGTR